MDYIATLKHHLIIEKQVYDRKGKVVNFVWPLDNYMEIFVPKKKSEVMFIGTGEVCFYSCLIFLTIQTDSHFPMSTKCPVPGFLRPPQTQIYTVLCCLWLPATLSSRCP